MNGVLIKRSCATRTQARAHTPLKRLDIINAVITVALGHQLDHTGKAPCDPQSNHPVMSAKPII